MYSINLRHKQTNRLLTLTFHNVHETEIFQKGWDLSKVKAVITSRPKTKYEVTVRCHPSIESLQLRSSAHRDILMHGADLQPDYIIENILTPAHERILNSV